MYVSKIKFEEVLERFYNHQILNGFYNQDRYDFLLLFVSSFDGNDLNIVSHIVDNAKRIDRITGRRICFFYFIDREYDEHELDGIEWIARFGGTSSLFDIGAQTTIGTADDICQHFGILRSNLPAFILINQNKEVELYSIHDYYDFEYFLSPLNILHSYIEDKNNILSRYESDKMEIIADYQKKRKQTVVTQKDVDGRKRERSNWINEIKRLEGRIELERSRGEYERVNRRIEDVNEYKRKLKEKQELVICGEDESVPYPQEELDKIHFPQEELDNEKTKAIEKINISLNTHDGLSIIEKIQDDCGYTAAILKIWNLVKSRNVRISKIIENIRYEIRERGFDVFISCKSQDYVLAHDLYDYLRYNGFRPFLADMSITEVGIDQYTALIGEVINVCDNMIVFATDVDYIETPYVSAEWHTFVNDLNTGRKPNAKIVNILSPNIDIHRLPAWLRDKQCFTTENYRKYLLQFLRGGVSEEQIEHLKQELQSAYIRYRDRAESILSSRLNGNAGYIIGDFVGRMERDMRRVESLLEVVSYSHSIVELGRSQSVTHDLLSRWEIDFNCLLREIEQRQKVEEEEWAVASQMQSEEGLRRYLMVYPNGLHAEEAHERIKYYLEEKRMTARVFSYSPSPEFLQSDGEPTTETDVLPGAAIGSSIPVFGTIGSILGGIIGGIGGLFAAGRTHVEKTTIEQLPQKLDEVYSSIFAPAETKRKSHIVVQVYLHLYEDTEKVKALALESEKNAERRDYIPLQCKLKKGDKVDVLLNIYGETLMMSVKKSVVWQGSFTKCSFDYFVPGDINVDELSCAAMLTVNGVPVGEMRFITRIVESPRQLNPEIIAHKYNKVFISYAHKDEAKVKSFHEGLKLAGIEHFFDRNYLQAGDIFPQVIQDYINTADLFVLFWSENASKSEYVQKERLQALERAFPQVKPEQEAKLRIYPMSIEPRAELPGDMRKNYHFGEM